MNLSRIKRFLKAHPVVCLLLLSPGIPEYLTGSSPFSALILNPFQFVFQLAANLGLYGPGVLLVREAQIRWKKGLATVLLLGAAYGILEEGVALSTLYYSNAGPVGALGTYGHWLGVNWIWTASIIPVHMIFSIALPIALLNLALPGTRGVRFLSGRRVMMAVAIIGADVVSLFAFVQAAEHFWMGWPVFFASWGAIIILAILAQWVYPDFLRPVAGPPAAGTWKAGIVGAIFFPTVLLTQFVPEGAGVLPAIDFIAVIVVQGVFLVYLLRVVGSSDNEQVLLSLALGLMAPIAAFGLLAEIQFPVILAADLLMVAFVVSLKRRYRRMEGLQKLEYRYETSPGASSSGRVRHVSELQ